ncbi:hypothetical protein [Hymenobacter sp. GOD-10R]|uniref:hypothetical protein n=1 Tax=Hymenobacter sp. GOD-10R TaxID=3093922 RepID=UPI002D77B3A3|nr:hypothetical protein [Hymenobacter sp. GOD-10R]WRQ28982.1 hypothetical protein SD425_01730 [Hymenobacter sp. GOD-10R]
MNCILCFLEDPFQDRLRTLSLSKSERFEEVLKEYQNNFINEYNSLIDVDKCEKHKKIHINTQLEATHLHQEIKSTVDIRLFFDEIRKVYTYWIKGNNPDALLIFDYLLNQYDLLKSSNKIDKSIFFRGRKSSAILNKTDLFHIPFNKRHLIQNQRYSITGQPLLYLGLSPIDVVAEIRGSIESLENIYFCSFRHKSPNKLLVLDITNEFPDLFINHNVLSSDNVGAPSIVGQIDIRRDFCKFILSQVCSFKRSRRSEGNAFAEEYVLPQLLTEILRKSNFKGILFSSTRVDYNKITSAAPFYANRYRENVALFTSYEENNDIDTDLFNQFVISKPITTEELTDITLQDLKDLRKKVFSITTREQFNITEPFEIKEVTGIRTQTFFEDLHISNEGNSIRYFDHTIGKIHLQLVYQILLDFRNNIHNHTSH